MNLLVHIDRNLNLYAIQRETNKHAVQMDELRNNNRALSQQWFIVNALQFENPLIFQCSKTLENGLAQLNTEHVEVLVSHASFFVLGRC